MSTELIEMRDEDGSRMKTLRFCTSVVKARFTNDDPVRVQVGIGEVLETNTFNFNRQQWAEFSKAVQEAFDEFPLQDEWTGRSWVSRLQVLSDESTVMAPLLRENEELKDMIRQGESKEKCLAFINENW